MACVCARWSQSDARGVDVAVGFSRALVKPLWAGGGDELW